jgi:DNA-binding transcriptional ArsR family regulator
VIHDPCAAIVALDPVRSRLLSQLSEPASAATLSARLGTPRQKVNYHLRALEEHQLVSVAKSRQWGGLTERLMVASAASYVVQPPPWAKLRQTRSAILTGGPLSRFQMTRRPKALDSPTARRRRAPNPAGQTSSKPFVFTYARGERVILTVSFYLSGDGASATAAAWEPLWKAWMAGRLA